MKYITSRDMRAYRAYPNESVGGVGLSGVWEGWGAVVMVRVWRSRVYHCGRLRLNFSVKKQKADNIVFLIKILCL